MGRRRKNTQPRRLREKYLIIVDGQTEKWYFEAIKRHVRLDKFHFKPEIGKLSSSALQEIFTNLEIYSKVFWIIDFDVILKEQNERKASKKKKTEKTKFQLLQENYRTNENLVILINNPCLELWFLLHYVYRKRSYLNCNQVIQELKKFMPNYRKSRKFYLETSPDIYQRLADKIHVAIENAKRLASFDSKAPQRPLAEIYKLIELIFDTSPQ